MASGSFAYWESRRGAVLDLWCDDPRGRRVYGGPREGTIGHGVVAVFHGRGGRHWAGLLQSTPGPNWFGHDVRSMGQLVLRGLDTEAVPVRVAEMSPEGLLIHGQQRPPRHGVAVGIRPVPDIDGSVHAELGIEEGPTGGYLRLQGADRSVRIDQNGVHVHPNKDGFHWEFVAEHPDDPDKELHYAVVEGPEAGVFVRGTAKLRRGVAKVALPDHFAQVASTERLTAQLTPRSDRSKGVAATKVSTREIEIRELARGRGSYEVDYVVHGVRKGCEGYSVERPRKPGWKLGHANR